MQSAKKKVRSGKRPRKKVSKKIKVASSNPDRSAENKATQWQKKYRAVWLVVDRSGSDESQLVYNTK